MDAQYLLYVLALVIAAAASKILAIVAWRRRPAPGLLAFSCGAAAVAVWSLAYALELTSHSVLMKVFWAKVQYLGIVSFPVAWVAFSLEYTGHGKWLSRYNKLLLIIVPLMSLLLVWTNEIHHLVWEDIRLDLRGPIPMLALVYGPAFWVYWAYAYLLLLLGTTLFLRMFLRAPHVYRRQADNLLVAVLMPWLGNALYVTHLNPIPNLDLTPMALSVSTLVVAWGFFRFHLFDVVPIARWAVVDSMSDSVFVLDAHNRVVDLNPAAERLLGHQSAEVIGQPAASLLCRRPDLIQGYLQLTEAHDEIVLGEGAATRSFDLRITPLLDHRGNLSGRLVVLRDISERKRAEEALQKAHDELERRVRERTTELSEANSALRRQMAKRQRAEQDLQQYNQRLQILHEIDRAVLAAQSPAEIAYAALQRIWHLVPCWRASVVAFGSEGGQGVLLATFLTGGTAIAADTCFPLEDYGLPDEFQDHRAKLVNEVTPDSHLPPLLRILRAEGLRSYVQVPLTAQGQLIGLLNIGADRPDAYTAEHIQVAREVADSLAIAIRQAQLFEEIRAGRGRLQALSQRLVEVQDAERQQLARELHDWAGQSLTALNINLNYVRSQLSNESAARTEARLADALTLVEETTRHIHDVMASLHPAVLDDYGLLAVLRWYSKQYAERTGITMTVIGEDEPTRLPPATEIGLFRIVQEALTNVARHAAASEVVVEFGHTNGYPRLTIADNGKGFVPTVLNGPGRDSGWGLITMRERAAGLGGRLHVESAPGQGTRIVVAFEENSTPIVDEEHGR